MVKQLILKLVRNLGYDLVPIRFAQATQSLVIKPLDPIGVEILADPAFQASCKEVYGLTLLDTPRLANLWQLCRLTDPQGLILEVGCYRGGSALHLSNSCPERPIVVCDSFAGFAGLDPVLDHAFDAGMFKDASQAQVEKLFTARGRQATVIAGYFPASCAGRDLAPVSFAHLDVDTYQATHDSLEFILAQMMAKSLIVLDDYCRTADGINRAIAEFTAAHPDWAVFPLFPSQALLVSQCWFRPILDSNHGRTSVNKS